MIDNAVKDSENVKKLKNILDEAQKTPLETLSTWYSFFNMKEDPFSAEFQRNEPEYFVDQEQTVKAITFDIGVSKRGIPIIELLVGPSGSGKSSILYYLHSSLKQLSQEEPNYVFKGEFMSMDDLLDDESDEENLGDADQRWIKISPRKHDYFFFDDADSSQITSMMERFVNTNLKLFAINPKQLEEIQSKLSREPNILYIKPLQLHHVKNMLDIRIRKALVDINSKLHVEDIFDEEALKLMVKFCFGVPKLILRCASTSLESLRQNHIKDSTEIGKKKITKEIMELSCKKIKCYHAYKYYHELREHKYEILIRVIEKEKTPTEVSSEIQKDRTTVSRHLSEMKELGLVDQWQRGRESYYKATESVKILMEIDSLPKGVWNID